MNIIYGVICNKSIVVPAITWFLSQSIKVLGRALSQKKIDIKRLIGSGGMPSAHSSFMVCLSTVVGKSQGWHSYLFGVTFAISLIVMYDAAGVRRAAGNQAKILNKIIMCGDKIDDGKELKELLGHSPIEVVIGALLGFFMGMVFG